MRWQKNTGDYTESTSSSDIAAENFRALEFQVFDEKKIRIDWVSLSVWGKSLVVTNERVFIFLCASPPPPLFHFVAFSSVPRAGVGRFVTVPRFIVVRLARQQQQLLEWKVSFFFSFSGNQKGQQNNITRALLCVYGPIFSIANGNRVIECSTCRVPVFQTETTRPMCNRVLIYIPSLNRNIVSFSSLRVMLLLLLSSQFHRLKMETRTKGMSHDEAVWVKRGQHIYFSIRLDTLSSIFSIDGGEWTSRRWSVL